MNDEKVFQYEDSVAELPKAVEKIQAAIREIPWAVSERKPINWTQSIPHSDSPGVYLTFSETGELIYIGKAERPMGLEVWAQLMRGESDADVRWQGLGTETDHPRFIATIPIPEGACFLAPALEGLLIETLNPKLNVHKKRR